MLLTDTDGTTHKVGPSERLLVGVYLKGEEDQAVLTWEQDNFPLDEDSNVPKVWRADSQLPASENQGPDNSAPR